MKIRSFLLASAIAVVLAVNPLEPATAQGTQDRMAPGMMQRGSGPETGRGMMQDGISRGSAGSDMCMMHGGMGSGMTGQQMDSGSMGSGMMGSGMMQQGGARSGMAALFGSRVRPVMNLSVEDVRGYLASQLERLNNKRLKVGDLESEDGTITADIVTVDNSLVQRLKVDRHTGAIQYEN
jgi:hypothetical protein